MKRLRVILLFLLLGAIVNVALAWGITVTVDPRNTGTVDKGYTAAGDGFVHWQVKRYKRHVSVEFVSSWFTNHDDLDFLSERASRSSAELVPGWADYARPQLEEGIWIIYRYTQAYGWPFRTHWNGSEKRTPFAGPGSGTMTWSYARLSLIWPGIVANTIVYAIAVWIVFAGLAGMRRLVRSRRRLCLECGYDLRGVDHEACPECGTKIGKAGLT